jgi:hypothetical protein
MLFCNGSHGMGPSLLGNVYQPIKRVFKVAEHFGSVDMNPTDPKSRDLQFDSRSVDF